MQNAMFFSIISFFYCLITLLTFIIKKKEKSVENRLYTTILCSNFFGLILELFIHFSARGWISISSVIGLILLKLLCIYMVFWVFLMTIYVCIVSVTNESLLNRLRLLFFIVGIVSIIVISALPLNIFRGENITYSYGPGVNATYCFSGFYILSCLIMLFVNMKSLIQKKYLPIVIFLILGTPVVLIQQAHPELTLMLSLHTLVTCAMYFTVENPDAKLKELEEQAKNAAIMASRAKSEFLSSMSHELRTPLNAIVGLSEDVESFRDHVPADVQEDSTDIINASNTLLELIGGILDLSKIESGKLEIVESDYAPKEEIESLVKIQRTKVAEKPLTFNTNISPEIPDVLFGDRLRIKQVLNNLISNAIKYTEKGTIDFTVTWNKELSALDIKVSDTGRGIKEEDKDKLFAKFERLQVEKVSSVQGTGLGLAITKDLIELMGGTIDVDSVFGKGSTFHVIIPQKVGNKEALEKLKADQENSVPKNLNYSGMRMLVVDDNPLNIKVLKKAIKTFNFIVDEGSNGQDAINKIKGGNKYDIILMDILMPIMGGAEALAELKKIPDFNTPVVALTADAMTGAKEKYMGLGFNDYLAKPFSRDVIAKKLFDILGEGKPVTAPAVPDGPLPPTLEETITAADPSKLNNALQDQAILMSMGQTQPIPIITQPVYAQPMAQPVYTQPQQGMVGQPMYAQPQPVYAQPVYTQPIAQPVYAQPMVQQPMVQETVTQQTETTSSDEGVL